jgi:hypothetical protein
LARASAHDWRSETLATMRGAIAHGRRSCGVEKRRDITDE